MSGRYDFELDMKNDNSLSLIINMIEDNTKVLEVGCANGRMTRYLKESKGCIVDIIELDEQAGKDAKKFCRTACLGEIEGNVENSVWESILANEQYDYIVFADVLEHLHDPQRVLIRVKDYLKDAGSIVLSTPNLAHNAVLLKLFNNDFEYQEIGLLDKTHIHFFTYNSLKEMIKNCGYSCEEEKATYCRAEDTELGAGFEEIPVDIRKFIKDRKYGNVYQFVFKITKNQGVSEKEFDIDKKDLAYQLKCYYMIEGMEYFSESYCEKVYYPLEKQNFEIEIQDNKRVTGLRIDPMECSCIIKHFHVYDLLNGRNELQIKTTNGIISKSRLIFGNSDPLLEMEVPVNNGVIKLEICFQVEYFDNQHIVDTFHMLSGERKFASRLREEHKKAIDCLEADIENLKSLCVELEKEKEFAEREMEKIKKEQEQEMTVVTEELLKKFDVYRDEERKIKEAYEDGIRRLILKCEALEKEKQEVVLEQVECLKEKEVLSVRLDEIARQKKEAEEKFALEQKKYIADREALKSKLDEVYEKGQKDAMESLTEKAQLCQENERLILRLDVLLGQKNELEEKFQKENEEHLEKMQVLETELLEVREKMRDSNADLLAEKTMLIQENAELKLKLEKHDTQEKELNTVRGNYVEEIDKLREELKNAITAKNVSDRKVLDYMAMAEGYEQSMNAILNSNSWKLTKGYRFIGDKLRGLKKRNDDSTKSALAIAQNVPVGRSSSDRVIYFENAELLDSLNQSIAVHLHLYYIDLLDEFFNYLNNIPYKFDLYVSCKEEEYVKKITKKMKHLKCVNNVVARKTINRGRDIAPFYVQFGKELANYDYLLHIHSKKSLFTGSEQKEWRQYCLECLLGSEEQVKKIFGLMAGEKNVGLFFPETIKEMHMIAHDWLANQHWGRALLSKMGIEFDNGLFNYPVGSFFWVKRDAIHQIFDMQLSYEDFDQEAGQTDGTIAHALERVLPFVAKKNGYRLGIFDLEKNEAELDYSYKLYQSYFSLTSDAVQYHLSQYELVTFDIFDTLITRCVLCPDDVFEIMSRKIKARLGLNINFLEIRKKAEALANETKFDRTSIHDIYREMPRISKKINSKLAKRIKEIEIETELEVCIPRRDMLKVFNHVKQNGRKIILISDMYLTSDIIAAILKKCGYEGYESIIVSCEVGLRKDRNTIWDDFYGKYGNLKSVHVGDNPRSDIQLVGDRLKHTFYVMNPLTAFKLSKSYGALKKYINTTLENSLMLGLLINGELYNSPFSMNAEGEPEIVNPNTDGYIGLGPVFTVFSDWLVKNQSANTEYWFLAREGFVFNEMYRRYLESSHKYADHIYFLTSRRSASVAAIKKTEDIKEILQQFYRGGLQNLLKTRLGLMECELDDIEIEMPRDIELVMDIIRPYEERIFSEAEKERKAYLSYIESVRKKGKRVEVVDVGYSGTIQYFLMKLLNQKLDGKYLSTQTERKPEKIGGSVEALYFNHTLEEQNNSVIFKNQLLLEAILQAPHGQVIKFEESGEGVIPVLKENKDIPESITAFQNGALEYVTKCAELVYLSDVVPNYDKNLAEDILEQYLASGWMSDGVAAELSVEDDYCTGGIFKYSKGQWKERG